MLVMFDVRRPLTARIVVFVGSDEAHIFDRGGRLGRFGSSRRGHGLGIAGRRDGPGRQGAMNPGNRRRGLGFMALGNGLSSGGLGRINLWRCGEEDALIEKIGLEDQEYGGPKHQDH